MVMNDVDVRILFVVVARVVSRKDRSLLSHGADEVNVRVVENFLALVCRQNVTEVLEDLLGLTRSGLGFGDNTVAGPIALARALRRWTVTRHVDRSRIV